MGAPWGMINAKKEAEQYRQDARQARDNEKILSKRLVDLIKAVEDALNDLQDVEESKQVRKNLQVAVKNAKKGYLP